MIGKICIELTARKDLPDSGSKMPDLGHDAYFLKKELMKLSWTENGKEHSLAEKYSITALETRGT